MISKIALKKFLHYAPANWVLVRIPECELLSKAKLPSPVLDVGCGDGYFAKVLLSERKEKKFSTGIDFSESETVLARKSKVYDDVVKGDIKKMPFKNSQFKSAFSNGTLEHINGIDQAIKEISRVIKKGGTLAFTVPSKHLGSYLFFSFIPGYKTIFNKIFGHLNLFDHKQWQRVLIKNKLKLIEFTYYNSKGQIMLHDLLCWWAFPAFVCKAIFGKWIMLPKIRVLVARLELPLLERVGRLNKSQTKGGSLFIVAQKL